jgi:hypothetical protein
LWRRPRPKLGCGAKERRKKERIFCIGDRKTKHYGLNVTKNSPYLIYFLFEIAEVFAAVKIQIEVLWVVLPCSVMAG